MCMKTSILTMSQTGNTLKVATAISEELQKGGLTVEHLSFLRRKFWNPSDADLIGVGCPVFENRPAEVVPDFLKERGFDLRGKKAFVFITSGGSPAKSLFHLAEAVRRTGADVVGGIQVRGSSSFPTMSGVFPGRPDPEDLEQARVFGRSLSANLISNTPMNPEFKIDPGRGGIFYNFLGPLMQKLKKMSPTPKVDPAKCDLCATCVAECPSGSIKIKGGKITVAETCIRCYWCWQICPPMAIEMKFSPGDGAIERNIYCEWLERRIGDIKPGEPVGPNFYRDVLARKLRVRFDPDNRSSALFPAVKYSRKKKKP